MISYFEKKLFFLVVVTGNLNSLLTIILTLKPSLSFWVRDYIIWVKDYSFFISSSSNTSISSSI